MPGWKPHAKLAICYALVAMTTTTFTIFSSTLFWQSANAFGPLRTLLFSLLPATLWWMKLIIKLWHFLSLLRGFFLDFFCFCFLISQYFSFVLFYFFHLMSWQAFKDYPIFSKSYTFFIFYIWWNYGFLWNYGFFL